MALAALPCSADHYELSAKGDSPIFGNTKIGTVPVICPFLGRKLLGVGDRAAAGDSTDDDAKVATGGEHPDAAGGDGK